MTPIIWSPQAADDIVGIQTYISADSVQYAELVVGRIVARVEQLSTFPESGRVVPERQGSSVREVIVKPHRIVYRFQGSVVEIVTVFRGTREFPTDVR
ncbi:MAG: type II toxin-antitoxin system RelE/ParE family toxin [Vicinamibacterales bacterium]